MASNNNVDQNHGDPLKLLIPYREDDGCVYVFGKKYNRRTAILVVDIQNDFITGSLALKTAPAEEDGADVIPVINDILKKHQFDLVIYTKDWHPPDHCSFVTNVSKYKIHPCSKKTAEDVQTFQEVVYDDPILIQVMWPPHCIQGTFGAEFHKDLKICEDSIVLKKGGCSSVDSYSAFWDNARQSQTKLQSILAENRITTVFIAGLATDYCVGATSVHAAEFGFDTYIIEDACRGIYPAEIEIRKEQMQKGGVKMIQSYEIPKKGAPWLTLPPISPGRSPLSPENMSIKHLLENFLIFNGLEEFFNQPDDETNWFKYGHQLSKVVNIPEGYLTRLRNRIRAGGGNPAEELFHNVKIKFPELELREFHARIDECSRNDISAYMKNNDLPHLFNELSLEHEESICAMLNNSHGPGWDILAARCGYTTSEIDYIRSISIQSGHGYSPTGSLLRKLKQIAPDVKVRILINAAHHIRRIDVVDFLTQGVKEMNDMRGLKALRAVTL